MRVRWLDGLPHRRFSREGYRQPVGEPVSLTLTGYLRVVRRIRDGTRLSGFGSSLKAYESTGEIWAGRVLRDSGGRKKRINGQRKIGQRNNESSVQKDNSPPRVSAKRF